LYAEGEMEMEQGNEERREMMERYVHAAMAVGCVGV